MGRRRGEGGRRKGKERGTRVKGEEEEGGRRERGTRVKGEEEGKWGGGGRGRRGGQG